MGVVENNTFEILQHLGLPCTQAKIYLALLDVDESSVKTISKISGIDRAEVYRKISSLLKLGLIEKILGVPIKFKAAPLEDSLNLLLKKETVKHNQLKMKIDDVKKHLKHNHKKELTSGDQFVIIPGKKAHISWLKNKYNTLQKCIFGILTWKDDKSIQIFCSNELKKAASRGVKSKILVYVPKNEQTEYNQYQISKDTIINTEKRVITSRPLALGGIFDQNEVVIGTTVDNPIQNADSVFWSNNPSVVSLFKNYFDELWEKTPEASMLRRIEIEM